ncbi:hypothetical protein Tco_0644089 [Tanacetum coccineum]
MYFSFIHCENKEYFLRVLRIILVILPEHPSGAFVFTMKMEILLEPTSNKLLVDSILQAGNPVKEILLKLNLPDHRSILTDSKVHIKMEMESSYSCKVKFLAACSYSRPKVVITSRKIDLKLSQTLRSTSSSVCLSVEVCIDEEVRI